MGLVNGFVDTKSYIRTVFKKRLYGHCLDDIDLDNIPEEALRELHTIAAEDEKNWLDTLLRICQVKWNLDREDKNNDE